MIAYALLVSREGIYELEQRYQIIETTEELDEPWTPVTKCPDFTSREHALLMLNALREAENRRNDIPSFRQPDENRRPVMDGGGLSGAN